ncbi:SpoIIE family protein phosphatase [Streptomyces wuyuanensis]|uniref:SpoIIE family protein phosphatase n=1 Tax=Streptomyces wuyuanensis TaxID=1196353 RepID=UPI003710F68D
MTFGSRTNTSELSDAAFALFDDRGATVAWTQAAERLVGYSAGEVVGRSAALVLPPFAEVRGMSAFVEQCRARNGWPGVTAVRHRDGHMVDVSMRISMLRGLDGAARWLASVSDTAAPPGGAVNVAVRGALLTSAPVGISVRDLRLRSVAVNDALETHDGIHHGARLGRRISDVQPGAEAEAVEAVMRQVLQSGTAKVHEYRMRLAAGLREQPFEVSFHCLQGADGLPLGTCMISVNVADRLRERERLSLLGQAGTRLGRTLDVMQTGQELADLAVPLFADFAAVDLEHSVLFGEGSSIHGDEAGRGLPVLRRAGLASIRHGAESPWGRGEPIPRQVDGPAAEVLGTGKSRLEPVLDTAAGWLDKNPALARSLRMHGVHSLIAVPILARRVLMPGRRVLLGVVVFTRSENPVPFQDADLLLAEELVGRAAQSLDNARRFAREQTTAMALQRSLLPRRLRGGAAVETASRYLPADIDNGVGGDWFDVIPLSGARVALVVGDVVGHGINAAATMGRLRTAVHTLADMELPPDELLTRLDDTVQRLSEADDGGPDPSPVGATCVYAVYDPVTRLCTIASAGHPPPAIVDPQGGVAFPDIPSGAPLGIGLGVPFEAVRLELPEGSLLALYTDGMVESRSHDIEEGMHRLGTTIAEPGRTLEDLCARAMEPFQGRPACDDVTLLLVRTRALDPAHVATWTLPGDHTAVRRARELAVRQLTAWGLRHLEDNTELIVSELVTNAIRHSTGPIDLRLIQHTVLTCEVGDGDSCVPRIRSAPATDENGRGLFLVSQLSRRWGSRLVPGGKVVWAEQELTSMFGKTPDP